MGSRVGSRAEFRAIRECVGASRQFLADKLGVAERSVKRWEDPRYAEPPQDAWALLYGMLESQRRMIDSALDLAEDMIEKAGREPAAFRLNYYRSQNQYEIAGRDDGDYNIANANARAVATALDAMGYSVEWAYPDEEGYTDTPRN